MSTRFRGFEDRIRKLGALGAWLCFVVLLGLAAVPTAGARTVTYIHTDALGSVVAERDANGKVIKRYDYQPYGAVVGGQVTDGPGYTGHVSGATTGLSYMQQRYMDPQLGMFLSVDPVTAYEEPAGQFNRYRYANGNPYKFTDPDGRESGAAFKVVNNATNGQPITPPPRNPNDRLGPAIGAALTAVLAAPVLAEVGLAAMANQEQLPRQPKLVQEQLVSRVPLARWRERLPGTRSMVESGDLPRWWQRCFYKGHTIGGKALRRSPSRSVAGLLTPGKMRR
ncbi:tRNA(Glu)-specific nuclease WapA precursor [compost metagenome]